jgi:hypothetical protein
MTKKAKFLKTIILFIPISCPILKKLETTKVFYFSIIYSNMSSNRILYDTCEYKERLVENVNQLQYTLDPVKFYHPEPCRMQLGVVGGNNVSQIKGNLVDLESDLLNITRKYSECPSEKFKSLCENLDLNECKPKNIVIDGPGCNNPREVDTNMIHLPPCNLFRYKPIPLPQAMDFPDCPDRQKERCAK